MTAEWTAEAAEVADASPTLGSPWIPVHEGDAFVPFSFEVQGEAVNFIQELGKLLQDGADQLTVTAYTTGSGSGQPKGVITALVAASGTVGLVAPATAETFAPADVYAVQSALPPRFQARGVERRAAHHQQHPPVRDHQRGAEVPRTGRQPADACWAARRALRASRLLLPRARPVFVVNSDVVETTDPTRRPSSQNRRIQRWAH